MQSTQTRQPSSQIITLPLIPELFNPEFLDFLIPPNTNAIIPGRRELEHNSTHSSDASTDTKKFAATKTVSVLNSAGSATLDAFNDLNARSQRSSKTLNTMLQGSWAEDQDMTLRMIWHIRSIHDGRGEKELFYRAFGWLYEYHPRTAISNLHMVVTPVCSTSKNGFAPHGYWKDLLNILALATCDELLDFHSRKSSFLRTYTPKSETSCTANHTCIAKAEQIKQHQKEKQEQYHERLTRKLSIHKYRALYIAVARLFADRLRKDINALDQLQALETHGEEGQRSTLARMISLAGKWAPTPGGSHDRVTNVSTAICQLLFSPNENVGPGVIGPLPCSAPHPISTDKDNCAILRNYYHRWILKPLREVIGCPEPLMSANKWKEIQYSRIPSICMSRNKSHFILHDPEGFQLYVVWIKSRRRKIGDMVLLPHELLGKVIELQRLKEAATDETYPSVAEFQLTFVEQQLEAANAQWRSLISRLKESSRLQGTLAVCDISDSTGSIHDYDQANVVPTFPSIALSLILASITQPPFNSGFINFSETPEFVRLESTNLTGMVNEIMQNQSGSNINLQSVFLNVLLPLAKANNVTKESMIKRIIVFTDKQFDHAAGMITGPWWLNRTSESERAERWEATYSLIEDAFEDAGYDVPEIVFWDLASEREVRRMVELEAERRGVVMMSGFSSAMMKIFLGEEEKDCTEVSTDEESVEEVDEEVLPPMVAMRKALYQSSYDGLVVLD